jgi:hypothetical protein
MPELGPYGSMRGEVRENLPYRDNETKNPASKINHLRVPKVGLKMRKGKGLRFSPRPRHPMEHRGEVLSAWFPTLRSRRARTDTLNGTRSGAQTTLRMVRGRQRRRARRDDRCRRFTFAPNLRFAIATPPSWSRPSYS